MKLLRSYADRAAAELDLDLLRANRIDAVLDAAGCSGTQDLRLSVPADQHLPALALLTDEAESHAQVPAVAQSAGRRTVVMLIRGAALFFIVNALLSLAALGEYVWRGDQAPNPPSGPPRQGAQRDFAHLAMHALMGGLLLAYAEPLARLLCRDRRPRP